MTPNRSPDARREPGQSRGPGAQAAKHAARAPSTPNRSRRQAARDEARSSMTPAPARNTRQTGKRQFSPQERAEYRRAEAVRLHGELTEQVQALVDSDQWKEFLDFSRSFYSYSLNNCLLIMKQHPSASAVCGYKSWAEKGRQVRRGEKAIKILGYSTKKFTVEDPETGEEVEQTRARFPVLNVFALDQTDPIEGVEDHSTVTRQLEGEDPAGLYERMRQHLASEGWAVERQKLSDGSNGYTTTDGTRRIVIDDDLSPATAAKVILHEGAHSVLHVDKLSPEEYRLHRGVAEAEAEASAYVLAGLGGLNTSDYSVGYVATWNDGDVETIRSTAGNVLAAVAQLAPALEADQDTTAVKANDPDRSAADSMFHDREQEVSTATGPDSAHEAEPLHPGVLQQVRIQLEHYSELDLDDLVEDPNTDPDIRTAASEELDRREHPAAPTTTPADLGVPAIDPPKVKERKDWAARQLDAGPDGRRIRYGSDEWATLPADDPARWASVVAAAEAWAQDGDNLEQRVADEVTIGREAVDRAWTETRENIAASIDYAAIARNAGKAGPADRLARDRAAAAPRPEDDRAPIPWNTADRDSDTHEDTTATERGEAADPDREHETADALAAEDTTDEIDTTGPEADEPEPDQPEASQDRASHIYPDRATKDPVVPTVPDEATTRVQDAMSRARQATADVEERVRAADRPRELTRPNPQPLQRAVETRSAGPEAGLAW